MKDFPRLYSLSTLGIRQHQEFDYKFHGFRTDFVGDSGCGKSMIADLVQLVFVGSEVFHSATESMDKRPVDGMVLKSSQGRGSDMAYILINVEITQDRFLVLGAYLESTSRHSRSFIIQADWDEDSLKPLMRPINVEDIYVGQQIPTIEMFQRAMEERGMVYHHFPQRKKFHQYLHKHNLLSIDLSQSHQILKDYAVIIQSFSRGKSLDISNSASLKSFLFGDEKAKDITEKYKKAVEDLQTTLKEYSQNRTEIELVKKKHQTLKTLRGYRSQLDSTQEIWLTKHCAYAHQQELEALESFKDSSKDYRDGAYTLTAIQQVFKAQLSAEELILRELNNTADSAQEAYNEKLARHSKLKPFNQLLKSYACTPEKLKEIYDQYQVDKYRADLIGTVQVSFKRENLLDLLIVYTDHQEIIGIIKAIDLQLDETAATLLQKEDLAAFADLNNEGSLGNWAIRNYQPYNREIESILMHYKNLPVGKAVEGQAQYVPSPGQLLGTATFIDQQENGFWITNGEIRQYVSYSGKQLFTATNAEQLKAVLESFSQDLKAEITILTGQVSELTALKTLILNTKELAEFLTVQEYAGKLKDFQSVAELNLSVADFETGIALMADKEQIEADFLQASEVWKMNQQALGNYTRLMDAVKKANEQLKNRVTGDTHQHVLSTILTSFPEFTVSEQDEKQQQEYYQSTFNKAANKETWVSKTVNENLQKIKLIDINKQLDNYEQLKKERAEAFKEARLGLAKEPDISAWALATLSRPVDEEKTYVSAKSVYESKFKDIVTDHAPGEAYKFENNHNYIDLCAAILPEAFLEEKIEKDTSIEIIEHYLSQINEKNKNLNTRKLQKIREILDEVGDEIGKRLDTVRQIHNFLNHEEREITGGHRVSLRHDTANSFPKAWIDAYVDKLEQENTLFAIGETLNELLKDSVSLEEKMINAFHAFGGHKASKPKIEDLLNPNSYFSLSFKMESHATGKTNSGSTGQTYAAIALLCIARLSLVNKSSFNKKPPEGIRFMPVDEAEGLGSNFDMLYEIAREFDYQILTMSINPLGKFKEGEQYIYMLSNNREVAEEVNYPPFGIFSDADQN